MEGGSPSASPTGATQQIDGAELARRMIEATESASQAATMAAQAISLMQSTASSGSSTDEKAWYKILPKPAVFEAKDRESEIANWRDWAWSFEQYIGSLDANFVGDIKTLRENPSTEVDMSVQTDGERRRGVFLYGLLASLLRQRALLVLKQITDCNGFEAYRQLIQSNEPVNKNRAMSLLGLIMNWPAFNAKSSYMNQILRLENAYTEYERLGNKLGDEIKTAVLLRSVQGTLKTWLQLSSKDSTTYAQMREAVLSYDRSTTKWSEMMVLGKEAGDTSGPMEVDRVKGDGKGKGKGKDSKGKGHKGGGKEFHKGGSWYDAKSKGKGKGKHQFDSSSKGKGKSDKGKGKGKREERYCYKCGKQGHLEKDCYSKTAVRQVQESEAPPSGSPSSSLGPPSVAYPPSTTSASTNQQVRRVENESTQARTLRFDMQSLESVLPLSSKHVRVVSCECEHFFIGDDTDGQFVEFEQLDVRDLRQELETTTLSMTSLSSTCFVDEYEFMDCPPSFKLGDKLWLPTSLRSTRFGLCGEVCQRGRRVLCDKVCQDPCRDLHIRGVREEKLWEIVLDSGSDATVLPASCAFAGKGLREEGTLWDAQGNQIATAGCREVQLELQGEGGDVVILSDRVHVSQHVKQPLISYGRLLKRGWTITIDDGPKLTHEESGIKIPITFKNDSLLVSGFVRMVSHSHVRHVDADIPAKWREVGTSWTVTGKGFPIVGSSAEHYIDPSGIYSMDEWPYRTTLGYNGETWTMLEFCEDLSKMDDRTRQVERDQRCTQLLTILTQDILTPEVIGFVVKDIEGDEQAAGSAAAPVAPAAPEMAVDQEGEGRQEGGDVERRADLPERQELVPLEDAVEIEGVRVLPTSSSIVLKAACKCLGLSQSGSKAKMWRRIISHVDKERLQAAQDIATQVSQEVQREAEGQAVAYPPEDYGEVLKHCLTHLPYAPWCESCVKAKGRPDAHFRDGEHFTRREFPCISFDLCFTGKADDSTLESVMEADPKVKLVCLVMTDSSSGAVQASPMYNKAGIKMMAKEICRFVQWLGYNTLTLRCDQEPTMLRVEHHAQQALLRLGYKVTVDNPKIRDHASNGLVESAVHRLRQMATVLQCRIEEKTGVNIPMTHAVASWAFVHAAWLINRYVVRGGSTPFEVCTGRSYSGKLAEFGEPVLAYCYIQPGPKGGARWLKAVFLTKSLTNDMFVVGHGNTIRLTRSIKRIYDDWHNELKVLFDFVVPAWMVEVRGHRLTAKGAKPPTPEAAEDAEDGTEDEAASDPPSGNEGEQLDGTSVFTLPDNVPLAAIARGNGLLTPVFATHTPRPTPAPMTVAPRADAPMTPAPALRGGEVREGGEIEAPTAKRPRLSVNLVGGEILHHVDEEFSANYEVETTNDDFWDDNFEVDTSEVISSEELEMIWHPMADNDPNLDEDTLKQIDNVADKIEVQRLVTMGVLVKPSSFGSVEATPLTAKYVRTWRKKTKDGVAMLMRRSRLVAREFNFMEQRTDCFAPSSSSIIHRLLPGVAMSGCMPDTWVLGSLDVTDAYLMVPQPTPRPINVVGGEAFSEDGWVINKCLPGQRDGARRWYMYFKDLLEDELNAKACEVQPAIFKLMSRDKEGEVLGFILLHVDDVLFYMDETFLSSTVIPRLGKHVKMSLNFVPRTGGSVEFLKKQIVVEANYTSLCIVPENKHIKSAFHTYTEWNGKPPRVHDTPVNAQFETEPHITKLNSNKAAIYRSLVGALLYVSHDRGDIQYATKNLAAHLKEPSETSWKMLGRLIGYLKTTEEYAIQMHKTNPGTSLFSKLGGGDETTQQLLIESFTDSDWSTKSTSCGVHYLSGNPIFSSSRSQKAIALSSTESEWYAAISTTIDQLYLAHIVEFMLHKPRLILRCDNTAVVSISQKLGTSRLRHIEGKLLWLQAKVAEDKLELKSVRTHFNVADVGTKGLGRVKHRVMCFLLGFSENGQLVGEAEFDELSKQEVLKKEQKALIRRLCFGGNSTMGGLSLAVTLATARAERVEQSSDALSFPLGALLAVLLVALGIWWRLSVTRASSINFNEVTTMSRKRTSESAFCYNPDSSDGEGVPPAASSAGDGQGESEEDLKRRNLKQAVMMATVITENMAVENYGAFERDGFMKSLFHLRLMIEANANGHENFVREVLNTLDVDKVAAKPMLDMLFNMTREPARVLTFQEEADYFQRYSQLITEHDRETLRNTNLNPGFTDEDEVKEETDEEKRRRYLCSSISEVSDVEYWLGLDETEEEYEEIVVEGEEPDQEAPNRNDGPGAAEPEGEDSVDILELQRRGEDMIEDINAIVRRIQARANEQEANGDLAGALRTRDAIDGLLNK